MYKAVSAHTGVTLSLRDTGGVVRGAVILSRNNNLSQRFDGPIVEALREAEQASLEQGFEGYYDVAGQDEITVIRPTELAAIEEINRQVNAMSPKAGVRWGFSLSWSPEELAAMPAAQAHVSRLVGLRDALVRKPLANV
jgi:hypothetical protein